MKPLWGSLFRNLERKDAVTRRASAGPVFAFAGTPYNPHWDLDRTIKDAYERVLWVNRIIDARSIACARLDVRVNVGDGPDAKPVDHRLTHLLNKRANRYETGKSFRYRLHAQFQLSKKGVFVEVILDKNHNEIAELHLLNPLYTTVLPDPDTFVLGFEVRTPSGEVSTLRPWNPEDPQSNTVLWFRKTHPFDPYASATWLDAAGLSIDLDHYARLYNRTFMQNDGRPGGLLAVSADIDTETADKLQARLSGGVGAAGKITVIGDADNVKYVDTSTSPRDAQYVESRAITKAELLVAGGTPLSVIGDASGRCVDDQTEALTQRGWVNGWDLTTDDTILSMDPVDGALKWSPIHEVYRNPNYSGPMYRLKHRHLDALVTPGHKWAVRPRPGQGRKSLPTRDAAVLCKVEDLSGHDHIFATGTAESSVTEAEYSTAFVELVGWAVTEGHYSPTGAAPYVRIRQNPGDNADRIVRCAKEVGAAHIYRETDGGKRTLVSIRGEIAAAIEAVAPEKILTQEFMLSLTADQREHLIQTMIDADGCRQKSTASWTFAQKDQRAAEAFMFLTTLAGYRSSIRYEEHPYTHKGVTVMAGRHLVIVGQRKIVTIQRPNARTIEHYTGLVWCPRTDYGTFVSRRNGRMLLTGNTFDNADAEEEAWWRQTNVPDLDIIAAFYDLLTGTWDDDLSVSYDYSVVAVLQRESRAREAQAQTEWDKGLITLDEYREATGKAPIGVPAARANWMVAGKTPIAKQTDFDAIQAAYGGGSGGGAQPGGPPQPPGGSPLPGSTTPGIEAPQGGPAPGVSGGGPPGAFSTEPAPGGAILPPTRSSAPPPAIAGPQTLRELVAAKVQSPTQTKSDGGVPAPPPSPLDPARLQAAGEAAYAAQQQVLDTVVSDLAALYQDFGQSIAARLGNANSRKHTRHWTGRITPGVEIKVLDTTKIVDVARWVGTFTDALVAHIVAAFGGAALDVATGLDWRPGDAAEAAAAESLRSAAAQVYAGDIIEHIRDHFTARTGRLERIVREADEHGESIAGIVDRVSEAMLEAPTWADADSRAVVGAMNAGGLSGATMAGATEKCWLSTPDERTRPTHKQANGQVVGIGKAFTVGEAELQYPGDPSTDRLEEIMLCRCSMAFRVGARTADTFTAQLGEDLAGLDAYEAATSVGA